MKKYKIKKTKKLIKKLHPYWDKLQNMHSDFLGKVGALEQKVEKATGIKGIEFFFCEMGYYAGIGNDERTMELIHDSELEDGKIHKIDT